MKFTNIESTKASKAGYAAQALADIAAPYYAAILSRSAASFWSVFGPAARYNFKSPEYAYAALMKP